MVNIQEWIAQLSKKQKNDPSIATSKELLKRLRCELLTESPDYTRCIESLASFSLSCTEKFYKDVYSSLPEDVQASLDCEFLRCVENNSPKPKTITSRFTQSVKSRLATAEYVNKLSPEVKWLISHLNNKYVALELQKIRDNRQEFTWQKLLLLDIQEWDIRISQVKSFYQILFDNSADATTQEMYRNFLKENFLDDMQQSDTPGGIKAISKTAQSPHRLLPGNEPLHKQNAVVPTDNSQNKVVTSEPTPLISVPKAAIENVPLSVSQQLPTEQEQGLEKDGVKLAELLLAWSRKQASGTAALKESLRMSERESNRLGTQLSSLRDELFAAKRELSGRDAEIASLRSQLAEAAAHLDSSRKQAAEFDETIRKLQRMNENSASQAVAGYKAELAAALKYIVEDARLPEAQKDADILSALLGDLLDTLRFKGIPLEEK